MKAMRMILILALAAALLVGCAGTTAPAQTETPTAKPLETEAPQPTETPAPADSVAPAPASDPDAAYEAYLALLESEREKILQYNWQKGMEYKEEYDRMFNIPGTVNVAFADVWGDETPELIYLRGDIPDMEYPPMSAELLVMGWNGTELLELYRKQEMDAQAGGGMIYRIFTVPEARGLWVYSHWYAEIGTEEYLFLTDCGDRLGVEQSFLHVDSYNPEREIWSDSFSVNDRDVTKAEFRAAVPARAVQAAGLLLRNVAWNEQEEDSAGNVSAFPTDGTGMRVDDAIAYLKVLLGRDEPLDEGTFFASLPDLYFASGVGGWSTDLSGWSADGSADAVFHDSEMGDSGPGYPNGTVYRCVFRVYLGDLEKLDDYRYLARVVEMNLDGPEEGESWIDEEAGIRYIWASPYGLNDPYEVLICLPGTPTADLPHAMLDWLGMPRAWGENVPLTLPCCALYNFNDETAFGG